jgi:hypothetical protein
MKSVAALCRQNIVTLLNLKKISELLKSASETANSNPKNALFLVDESLDIAASLKIKRNNVLDSSENIWYKDWLPLVTEANTRKYLHAVDDVKDHKPIRTPDMSYLIYHELMYPMDNWAKETLKTRNEFARKHSLRQRQFDLDWKNYSN